MGAWKLNVHFHDDELGRFLAAATDPGLAEKVQRGDLPDDAYALASVAPYIADCIRRSMETRDTPTP